MRKPTAPYDYNGARIYPPSASYPHWRLAVKVDGKRQLKGAGDQVDAEARADAFAQDPRSLTASHTPSVAVERLRVAKLVDLYNADLDKRVAWYEAGDFDQGISRTYGRSQRYRARSHVVPVIGDLWLPALVEDLDRDDCWGPEDSRRVLTLMTDKGLAPTYRKSVGQLLRSLVTFAHSQRAMSRAVDPMEDVKYQTRATAHAVSGVFIDRDTLPERTDIDNLVKAFHTMGMPDWALAMELAACSGVRRGELFALRPADFEFDARIVRIDRQLQWTPRRYTLPKWKKTRRVFFTEDLAGPLADLCDVTRLSRGADAPIWDVSTQNTFDDLWRQAIYLAGWPCRTEPEMQHRCAHCNGVVRHYTEAPRAGWWHRVVKGDPPTCRQAVTEADVVDGRCVRCGVRVRRRQAEPVPGWWHVTSRNRPDHCGRHLGDDDVIEVVKGRSNPDCPWTLHTLRHFAATWMLGKLPGDLGMDPVDVAYFMGHFSPNYTIDQYVGVRGNVEARVFETTRSLRP